MQEPEKLPYGMGFKQFWREAIFHTFTKAWIGVLTVSGVLAILIPCARLVSKEPRYQTFFDVLEKYWIGWILIVVFLLILVGRAVYAPYLIYKQIDAQRADLQTKLNWHLDTKRQQREEAARHEAIRNQIGSYLSVVKKFTKVCNDPEKIVPREAIDKWEIEVCIYLRENLSAADEHLFTSEIGIVDARPCRFIEERAEPLRRLHYRSHQLLKILERINPK